MKVTLIDFVYPIILGIALVLITCQQPFLGILLVFLATGVRLYIWNKAKHKPK